MPETIVGKPSSGSEPHCPSASRAEAMNPTDSSCGVVCALPTTNAPCSSTMNVSVIVPPASIASTRGTRAPALILSDTLVPRQAQHPRSHGRPLWPAASLRRRDIFRSHRQSRPLGGTMSELDQLDATGQAQLVHD